MKKKLLACSTVLLINYCITSAFADEPSGIHPLLSDKFIISTGVSDINLDGSVSLGEHGSDIGLQDDLGFDDSETVWNVGFKWRINNTSHVSLSYFNIEQDNEVAFNKTINWGDHEFDVGTSIGSDFDLSVWRAFYGYSLYKTEQAEFGIGGGLHILDVETELSGLASVNNAARSFSVQTSDVSAPLPNLGIYGGYAFSSKWYVGAYADWLSVNVDEYDGYLTGAGINLQYQAFKNVGFGLGYQYFETDYDVDSSDWEGSVAYQYDGLSVFMTVNF